MRLTLTKGAVGYPGHAGIGEKGIHYNRKTVALSLQRQGLRAKAARKFKATTQSKHNLPVADNLLKQDFTASQPNQKWAGDITYLWTNEGWYYLAVVIDLYSRKVIGWAMSERMTANFSLRCLNDGLIPAKKPKGVIVHPTEAVNIVRMTIKPCYAIMV